MSASWNLKQICTPDKHTWYVVLICHDPSNCHPLFGAACALLWYMTHICSLQRHVHCQNGLQIADRSALLRDVRMECKEQGGEQSQEPTPAHSNDPTIQQHQDQQHQQQTQAPAFGGAPELLLSPTTTIGTPAPSNNISNINIDTERIKTEQTMRVAADTTSDSVDSAPSTSSEASAGRRVYEGGGEDSTSGGERVEEVQHSEAGGRKVEWLALGKQAAESRCRELERELSEARVCAAKQDIRSDSQRTCSLTPCVYDAS